MGTTRAEKVLWTLVLAIVLSLLGMAVMEFTRQPSQGASSPATTEQKLDGLEKISSDSPEMQRFLRHERAAQKANQEAEDTLPR